MRPPSSTSHARISISCGFVRFFVPLVESSYQCSISCQVLRPPIHYKRRNNIIYDLVTEHNQNSETMRIHRYPQNYERRSSCKDVLTLYYHIARIRGAYKSSGASKWGSILQM